MLKMSFWLWKRLGHFGLAMLSAVLLALGCQIAIFVLMLTRMGIAALKLTLEMDVVPPIIIAHHNFRQHRTENISLALMIRTFVVPIHQHRATQMQNTIQDLVLTTSLQDLLLLKFLQELISRHHTIVRMLLEKT